MKRLLAKVWRLLGAPVNKSIDYLQAKFPVNRIVVLLTPLFVAGSAWISGYVAKHFPGLPPVSGGEVTALMVAGAGAALAAAYKWLDGWQKHEERGGTVTMKKAVR